VTASNAPWRISFSRDRISLWNKQDYYKGRHNNTMTNPLGVGCCGETFFYYIGIISFSYINVNVTF